MNSLFLKMGNFVFQSILTGFYFGLLVQSSLKFYYPLDYIFIKQMINYFYRKHYSLLGNNL